MGHARFDKRVFGIERQTVIRDLVFRPHSKVKRDPKRRSNWRPVARSLAVLDGRAADRADRKALVCNCRRIAQKRRVRLFAFRKPGDSSRGGCKSRA